MARLDATALHHLLSRSERLAATIMRTMARRVGNLQRLSVETVVLDGGEAVAARAIILATGVSWRSLAVPGAATLVGRGIYYGAARTEAPGVCGKDVYLVGGGNSAGQAALFFAGYARRVTLLIRASTIEQGMSRYLIDQLATKRNVHVELNATVVTVHGTGQLEAITVRDGVSEAEGRRDTDGLFVFIGADAETGWLPPAIARDERGYLLTGAQVQAAGAWPQERDPTCWRPARPASSRRATCATAQSNASPPASARAAWPSLSSTSTWPSPPPPPCRLPPSPAKPAVRLAIRRAASDSHSPPTDYATSRSATPPQPRVGASPPTPGWVHPDPPLLGYLPP